MDTGDQLFRKYEGGGYIYIYIYIKFTWQQKRSAESFENQHADCQSVVCF